MNPIRRHPTFMNPLLDAHSQNYSGEESVEAAGQGPVEEQISRREQAYWMLLGLGCTWFVNDAIFMQLPYWVATQPDGFKLGSRIALAGSLAPLSAVVAMFCRKWYPRRVLQLAIPVIIALSFGAAAVLSLGLWRLTSWFIYLAVFLACTVGSISPYIQVPWVLASGFKPAVISPLFLGGSCGSLCASLVAILQSPGDSRHFSPSIFFGLKIPALAGSLAAYG